MVENKQRIKSIKGFHVSKGEFIDDLWWGNKESGIAMKDTEEYFFFYYAGKNDYMRKRVESFKCSAFMSSNTEALSLIQEW